MTDNEGATLLGVTREEYHRLALLPTFPRVRSREALEAFKRRRNETAAQWAAA